MSKITTEDFIRKAREIHGDKYDYSKTIYTNARSKVTITCPIHGDFEQIARNHTHGMNCPDCALEAKFSNTEDFIEKAKKVHGNKYNYDKVNYINAEKEVTIVCPIHGDFEQTPHHHLQGRGCKECSAERKAKSLRSNTEEFVKRARKIHGNKYNYDKVEYVKADEPVIITCPIHGDFSQLPSGHLHRRGCPKCSESRLEEDLRVYLENNKINYKTQVTWDWLIYESNQKVDFYLPDFNIVIEAQGLQHFRNVEFFDKNNSLEKRIEMDNNKQNLCIEHGIKVYYYSNIIKENLVNKNFEYPYKVFEDIEELFKAIKKDFNKESLSD